MNRFHNIVNSSELLDPLTKAVEDILKNVSLDLSEAVTDLVNAGFNTSSAEISWKFSELTQLTPMTSAILLSVDIANKSGDPAPSKQHSPLSPKPMLDGKIHLVL